MFISLKSRNGVLVNLDNFDLVQEYDGKVVAVRTTYSEDSGYEDSCEDFYVAIESEVILCDGLSESGSEEIISEITEAIEKGQNIYYLDC